jgi:AAA domain
MSTFQGSATSGAAFSRKTAGAPKYTLLSDLQPNLRSNEIIKDLLPRRAFGEVHADSGAGKTAIITDMLLHVAAGMEYRNRRTVQQPVI